VRCGDNRVSRPDIRRRRQEVDYDSASCYHPLSDTVCGTLLAVSLPQVEDKAFGIGTDRETAITELAYMVRDVSGTAIGSQHVPSAQACGPHFEETCQCVPDVQRARQLLGSEAQVSLEEGLRRTIEWFRKQDGQEFMKTLR
jgi:UDP-glucose 4-epimerase